MALSAGLGDFHFLRPAWLLALPLLLALAVWLAHRRARDGDWSQLIDAELLNALRLDGGGGVSSRAPWIWLALAWSVAVVALAGPSWQQDTAPAFRGSAAWVLVMDLSPSMAATDLSPDRATRARYALDDLLGAAHDARVGLVAFSAEPYTVAPLTRDVATIRALLPPLAPDIMPSPGDRLAPALQRAGELLGKAAADRRRTIVVTDGFSDPAAAFAAAGALREQGVELSVIGVGTPNGAPLPAPEGGFARDAQGRPQLARLDPAPLRSLASAAGGRYIGLSDVAALSASLAQGGPRAGSADADAAGDAVELEHWRDGGYWLLPMLLLCAAALARRGWL